MICAGSGPRVTRFFLILPGATKGKERESVAFRPRILAL